MHVIVNFRLTSPGQSDPRPETTHPPEPFSGLEKRTGRLARHLARLDRRLQPFDFPPQRRDALDEFGRREIVEVLAEHMRRRGAGRFPNAGSSSNTAKFRSLRVGFISPGAPR